MVHIFTNALVRQHVYHPFVHVLTPKWLTGDVRVFGLRIMQWVYRQLFEYQCLILISTKYQEDSLSKVI